MTEAELAAAVALLESLADDPARLASIPAPVRRALLIAAGRLSRPDRDAQRAINRAHRKKDRARAREEDEQRLARTSIRVLRERPVFPTPPLLAEPQRESASPPLNEARTCYVCKEEYRELHFHYDSLCRACGDFNFEKRSDSVPLPGRIALVTGGRVKIGYHAAIKLLRAGAEVIVTTRFPRDAIERYAREPDFSEWRDRLHLYGLDLRHTPSVESLCRSLDQRFPRLDFLLNNACQTVRRPPGFYRHLLALEEAPLDSVKKELRPLIDERQPMSSARLSQLALLPGDELIAGSIFPDGELDADLQQRDLRQHNSWRLRLHEVPTLELLEVHLVNAVAPFVLNARLKPLMMRVPTNDKHIVNVSAMEGQFYRAFKTDKHPHTNMAKAALNMLTRTSAGDYVKDGIHMNSVDTGWITDEDPAAASARKAEEQGRVFQPPLDVVDGAARILAPIFEGLRTGKHSYGLFFKDYHPEPW
jgi:NAD(P)-dependent dehydrogenase (short-subunit alcohol dehydrogenase family)